MQRILSIVNRPRILLLGFVILVSYLTYVHGYSQPASLFWDENYHIASAQKYINGIYFMEPHPPLAKLFIALGEKIVGGNPELDLFIGTDYGKTLPDDFSFAGYRLFPTLFGWLTAPLLYLVFLLITNKRLYAALFSFLYIFDNAEIVHARSAMLDSTLGFFVVALILVFLLLLRCKDDPLMRKIYSIAFGVVFGCIVTTKANGLIMILLIPAVLYSLWPHMQRMMRFLGFASLGFAIVFVGVWYTHFAIGKTVNTNLPDKGYYQASEEYKAFLDAGQNASIRAFPLMLDDHLRFLKHYAKGVPRLDLAKLDENGSPFFFWPLGGRTINYRWETPDGELYRYLYLVTNPVVWYASFAGVLVAIALLVVPLFFPLRKQLKEPFLLSVFTGLYICYMIAIARLDRVMYLYHYFIPLLFSFIILALVFMEIEQIWKWTLDAYRKTIILITFATCIFLVFQFYRPLTYYEPISDEAFMKRAINPYWELTCVRCTKVSKLVVPRAKP